MADQTNIAEDAGKFAEHMLGPEWRSDDRPTAMPRTLAAALAAVQAEIPEVIKAEKAKIPGKEGRSGYEYSYADLGAVTRTILPRLGQYGLSWLTKPTMHEGKFVLVYKLLHASGESEEGIYPLPDRGSPQEIGSAITYARRYTLCSVTGVAPADDDDAAEATAGYHRSQRAAQEAPAKPASLDMSKFERDAGLAFLRVPLEGERAAAGLATMATAFQQALDFRACLEEHAAWLTPNNGDESPTWEELFTARVAAEIEAVDTDAQGKAVWGLLKAAELNMEHNGLRFSQLLNDRAAAIKERNAKALDTIGEQVVTADLDGLEGPEAPVFLSIQAALSLGRITDQQASELLTIASERRTRLRAEGAELQRVPTAYDLADAEAQLDGDHSAAGMYGE